LIAMPAPRRLVAIVAGTLSLAAPLAAQIVPETAPPAETVLRAISEEWLDADERKDLRVDHGVWDARDLDTPARNARAALATWRLDDPSLSDAAVDAGLRAEARLRAGRFAEALELLVDDASPLGQARRAEALEGLGRIDEAIEVAAAIERSPEHAVATARAAEVLDRLRSLSVDEWRDTLSALGEARAADRLDASIPLAEGRILARRHNLEQGVPALREALVLNPRLSEAWYLLGVLAIEQFDFDSADRAARSLEKLSSGHPLAACLRAESAIVRSDPDRAADELDRTLARHPDLPVALALRAAAAAARYRPDEMNAWLDRLDAVAPGGALGHLVVGHHLALDRQYEDAAAVLDEAIRRRPHWAEPRVELALLETQTGRDDLARAALAEAVRLDPFNRRASFSKFLLDELATHRTIETERFVIRFRDGTDRVVAELMAAELDRMSDDVTRRFDHVPARKTLIDLLPDHRTFGVRITGMPRIHTIAASTGPVIAIEVPREGPPEKHFGLFDWLKVLRHEYVHTVTLDQTRNRIPHWLTEAAAVSMEGVPRPYAECQMLARELEAGTLFDLDEINWAFVRPKRANDRPLAYAQGHWMVQFMNRRFGEEALVRLLAELREGLSEKEAFVRALGVTREEFHRQFLEFAVADVRRWGLSAEPPMADLLLAAARRDPAKFAEWETKRNESLAKAAELISERIGVPGEASIDGIRGADWPSAGVPPVTIDDALVAEWLERHPAHPDVLELAVRRRLQALGGATPGEDDLALLARYAAARPVDPYPHRQLAKLHRGGPEPARAIPSLVELDAREENDPALAIELARLYRGERDFAAALGSISRAVRIDPYDPALRELAAAIAVEAGDLRAARRDIEALTLLEPDREQHRKRLVRIDELLARPPSGG
jgi:Flp pilus assembly protein TadD